MKLIDPNETYPVAVETAADVFEFQVRPAPRALRDAIFLRGIASVQATGQRISPATAGELFESEWGNREAVLRVFEAAVESVVVKSKNGDPELALKKTDQRWADFADQVDFDVVQELVLKITYASMLTAQEKKISE